MREATVEGRNWYSWLQRNMHVWAIGFHAHAFSSSSEKIPTVSANSESVRPALICDNLVEIKGFQRHHADNGAHGLDRHRYRNDA